MKPKHFALAFLLLAFVLGGCVFLPTLTHPRSRDADGPDTTQKFDSKGRPNFGPIDTTPL